MLKNSTKSVVFKKKSSFRLNKRPLLIILAAEIVLAFILVVLLSQLIALNPNKDILYTNKPFEDVISCDEGVLIVNSVSVTVPTNHDVTYNISYTWGKDDTDYPTIPQSITATYNENPEAPLYNITLYRESFTPFAEVSKGKDASNWFSDWTVLNDENVKHEPKIASNLKGFLITTTYPDPEQSPDSISESYSFYFVITGKNGYSVYVLDGLLYESSFSNEFKQVMDNSTQSITLNNSV